MAGTRGNTDPPLIRELLQTPERFDFFQAVRLLEYLQPAREGVGTGLAPGREAVRFRSDPGLGFPASEIVRIAPPRAADDVPEMIVSFLGLTGVQGPLPRPFAEAVLERLARKDPAMQEFLDLFHHRLISLFYRVRKQTRIALHAESPEGSELAQRLFALLGLGTPGTRDRLGIEDRSLLRYAGLLAQQPRSMHGLERILSDYFAVPVEGRPFVGRWLELEPEQHAFLGSGSARLGEAVLGGRVWDQQGKFELILGPMSRTDFTGFLPGGDRLPRLVALTRFYIGPDLDFDVRLKLLPTDIAPLRLGGAAEAPLGWLSWLGPTAETREIVLRDPEQIVARQRAQAAGDESGGGQGAAAGSSQGAAASDRPLTSEPR